MDACDDPEAIARLHREWLQAERDGREEDVLRWCAADLRWRAPGEPVLQGIEAVRAWFRAQPPGRILDLDVATPSIAVDGNEATKSASFCTLWRGDADDWPTLVCGRHHWRLRREATGWRVAEVGWRLDRVEAPALLLVARRQGERARRDRLEIHRRDGSTEAIDMPRQGILPHDLVHAVVESALPQLRGFLGLVADGARAAFVLEATDGPRPGFELPDAVRIEAVRIEAVRIEAVVEALQSQLWAGEFDGAAFAEGVALACASRGIDAPDLEGVEPFQRLFEAAQALHLRWQALPCHRSLVLGFPLGAPLTTHEPG